MNKPSSSDRLEIFDTDRIRRMASPSYRTHQGLCEGKIYRLARLFIRPLENMVYWYYVNGRETHPNTGTAKSVYGVRRGAGGVPKKFSALKITLWLGLCVVTLPLIILGVLLKEAFRPGRGDDCLRFLDSGQPGSSIPVTNALHLATFNMAGLGTLADGIQDVRPTSDRTREFAAWIGRQRDEDLPIGIGLQEMFDQRGSQIFTDAVKIKYPYAVTSAGWSRIPFFGANSGLQFHSRVPITGAAFYAFEDLDSFGVKCSARGVLRVELNLGMGRTALVYVAHAQPYTEQRCQEIRKAELEMIRDQMRYDRYQDFVRGIDRGGNYFLMGDCNVANVDDVNAQEEGGGFVGEYDRLHEDGQVFDANSFFDPYLEEHCANGERIRGGPVFLEEDVHNAEREAKGWEKIEEPQGSFYVGAAQRNRLRGGMAQKTSIEEVTLF